MSETLILAARAAAEHYGLKWEELPDVNPVANGEFDRRFFLEGAEATLRAIRNAEHLAALVAGKNALYSCSADPELEDARACWHAMIDAALPSEPVDIPVSMGVEVIKGVVRRTMDFGPPLTEHFANAAECVGRIRLAVSDDGQVVRTFGCVAAEGDLLILEPIE